MLPATRFLATACRKQIEYHVKCVSAAELLDQASCKNRFRIGSLRFAFHIMFTDSLDSARLSSFDDKDSGKGSGKKGQEGRPVYLNRTDHFAIAVYSPICNANVEAMTPKKIWQTVTAGNKRVKHLSEFAEKDNRARQGIGLSRLAEMILQVTKLLKSEDWAKFLGDATPKLLENALAEATELEPHLKVLFDETKRKSQRTDSNSSAGACLRKRTEAEVAQAASVLFEWNKKEKSHLRGLLAWLGQGGMYFSAYCSIRVFDAWIKEGRASEEDVIEAAKAKFCADATSEEVQPDANTDKDWLFS